MIKASGYEFIEKTPPYCPLHNELAPCMYCLLPEVYELVKAGSDNKYDFYFPASDENVN